MSEADLGLRVFLIDNLSSPMGLLTGSLAMLGAGLISGIEQFDQMAASMGNFGAQMAEQEALMMAANQGFQDMGVAIQEATNEVTRLQNAGPMINQAELQQAENDLDYYEEKCRITQMRIDQLQMGPISPNQQSRNDIAIANAELQLQRYEQSVAASQAKITEINNAAVDAQAANIAEQNLAIDGLRAKQEAFGLASQDAANGMAAVDNEAIAANASLSGLSTTLTGLAATLGAGIDFFAFAEGIKQADQAASDLQDTMVQVSIAGNLTSTQLDVLQGYLMKVANNSIYTADEIGQGFSLLEEKGYGASQIMQGLGQDAVNLSEAIGDKNAGAVGATNLLATSLEVFKAKASEGAKYADLLKFAYYNGIPSVDGLRSALEQVGGRAQMLKIPFDQVVASLDSLGRAGMTGQQAGQSLNYALQALYAPINKTQNELEVLGIITANKVTPAFQSLENKLHAASSSAPKFDGTVGSLNEVFKAGQKVGTIPMYYTFYQWALGLGMINDQFYTADGKAKPFIDTLHILYQHLKSLNQEDLAAAIQQLFNVRSSQGITQLMNGLGQLDATYQKLKSSNDAHGQAQDAAAKRTSTQSAKTKELQTTFTDFMALVGNPFPTMIGGMLSSLNKFFGGLTTGNPQVHQFVTIFITVGAIAAGVALGIGLIALAFFVLDGALAPIILVVLAVAAGIALLAAGVALGVMFIQSHLKQVQAFLQPFILDIQTAFKALDFGTTINDLKKAFTELLPALKIVGMILGGLLLGAIAIVVGAIMGLVGAIGFLVKGALLFLQGAIMMISGYLNVFTGVIKVVWNAFAALFYLITGQPGKATAAFHGMLDGFGQIGKGLLQIVTGMWTMIKGVFTATIGALIGFIGGFVTGIIDFFQGLANALVHHSIIPDMIRAIVKWFFLLPGMVIVALIHFVASVVQGAVSAAKGFGDSLRNGIMSAISWLVNNASSWGVNIINMFINGVRSAIGGIGNVFSNIGGTIHKFLGFGSPTKEGPGKDSDKWMPNLMKMLVTGVVQGTPDLRTAAHNAANALHSGLTSPTIQGLQSHNAQGYGTGQGNTTTLPIYLDSQCIANVVIDRVSGQLVMNGINRTGR